MLLVDPRNMTQVVSQSVRKMERLWINGIRKRYASSSQCVSNWPEGLSKTLRNFREIICYGIGFCRERFCHRQFLVYFLKQIDFFLFLMCYRWSLFKSVWSINVKGKGLAIIKMKSKNIELTLSAPIPQNCQTHSNNLSVNCRRIVWVCLTILWDWHLNN